MNLNTITCVVKTILEEEPAARDSDRILTILVYRTLGINTMAPFEHILLARDIPQLATIGRIRRKVQNEWPELKPSEAVEAFRDDRKIEFINYAHERRPMFHG